MRKKRYVLNRRGLVGLFRKIIQAGASKAHQAALLRNAVINKIDINSPLKRLATLGHDFTPSYPKTESLPLAIPHSKGRGNYPFPLAGVNGPSHSYTSPLKAHPSFQDDEAEKKL
ncbi:hypothetical protein TNCV_4188161 [Trichonephila clavipes]|nr:hypothetical protein TNCV_4188161 [Trichonephila clavipes]